MATTTNYSWTTPDDTDLVKDGASAIRTLGSAIDTTVFTNAGAAVAKATVDAKGDLLVGTADNTVDRLAVGTDGFTLVADSSTATGLAYAAPSSGAFVKIASNTFSAQSSITVDTVFSSTYKVYMVVIESDAGTSGAEIRLQLRYSTTTLSSADYNNAGFRQKSNNTSVNYGVGSATSFRLLEEALGPCALNLYFSSVGNSSEAGRYWGSAIVENTQSVAITGGRVAVSQTYTGFVLFPSTGTFSGRYAVYGLEN